MYITQEASYLSVIICQLKYMTFWVKEREKPSQSETVLYIWKRIMNDRARNYLRIKISSLN
jgi:hypothetical protein